MQVKAANGLVLEIGRIVSDRAAARFVSRLRFMSFIGLVAALLGPAAARDARADEVRLGNGDVLHGEVLSGDEKGVKFKHAHGELTIPYTDIAAIQTDKDVELKLLDGTRLKGKLAPGPKPQSTSVETASAGPVAAEFDKIAALNEPPDEAVWTGRIALGLTIQDGNTDSKTFFTSFDGERLTKQDRIEAHAYYTYASTKDQATREDVLSARKGFARLQYSYYIFRPLYIYAGGAFEYDYFQDLKLRSRGGGGLGYAFSETKDLLVRLEAGLEYVNEDFRRAEDKDFLALRAAFQGEWQVTPWLRLGEYFEILPSLDRFRDFFCRSTSSANFALWKGFGLAGIVIWEHDEIPASPDLGRNDTTYIVTLTYVF